MEEQRINEENLKEEKITKGFVAVFSLALFIVLVSIIVGMNLAARQQIFLKVESASILQDEEVPEMKVTASCENDKKLEIWLEDNYTIKQLLDDLNAGKGYELKYEIDNVEEGEYPVEIVLDKNLEKKINEVWNKKIDFHAQNGRFTVKNKYGTWDGKKFKRLDGSHVTSDFIVSEGAEYYFDENGEMVTGEKIIVDKKCTFGDDGKLVSKERYVNPDLPMVALTFDDGPGEYTDALLQKLEENNSVATFLMMGPKVGQYAETVKKMDEMGCELGNHSWTHPQLTKLDEAGIRQEIDSTSQAIMDVTGHGPSVLRPPYGAFNDIVRSVAGLPILMWSVDTLDWKRKDAAQIIDYTMNTAADGDIILLHDIHSFSVDAALELIPRLREKGFQLVTVSELAAARGIPMEAGNKYFRFYKE